VQPDEHTFTIEEEEGSEGQQLFVARCLCGWSGVPGSGRNADRFAEAIARRHVQQQNDASGAGDAEASASNAGLEVWVGCIDVRAQQGNDIFEGAPGAFANAISLAADEADFAVRVSTDFSERRLDVLEFADVERLSDRRTAYHVPQPILDLSATASETGEVQIDTFQIYLSDD
jgi:hypothetical protein